MPSHTEAEAQPLVVTPSASPPHTHRAMNAPEWTLLLALSCVWGSSFFFYKILDAALPPFTIVLGRIGLAATALNLVLLARGKPLTRAAPWPQLAILGVLNCVLPFTLFAWAETHISSGMAAMLNATTPLFSVLLAHTLRHEKLTLPRAAGVASGLLGVAILIGPTALRGAAANLAGDLACIVASFSYAAAGQYGRRLRHLPALQVATGQLTAGTILLLPLAILADRIWTLPAPSADTWAALAGISLLCTALAYALFFRLTATAGPTNAMLVTFLLPLSALILGWLFLHESVPIRTYPGMLLIGLGLAAIDGRALVILRQKQGLLF